eukprot:gnl/TRDRNA2_/TRDRNA2_161584_c0_seq1.p1 gnl/TRDRNA2_/TRDRNA2_161584_c0~~gnl/TRDRNA2_/TRDRNA2_161584_c0_seq1.p1  ORF type:complete len:493 (-),score=90.57 gnl/TRDRNA2_/TRDRNA2_161584_c0_seq1:154-1632(-)
MRAMTFQRWPLLWPLAVVISVVDEAGRYRSGMDLADLAPPDPTPEDREASVNLAEQPPEKLFRLLAYELMREEKRPPEQQLGIRQFQIESDLDCRSRLLLIAQEAHQVSEETRLYHLNITGTAGLFWLLHKYPEEHSWVWLIAASHERLLRKVGHHFTRLSALSLDDGQRCLSLNFRTVLMNAASTWKRLHGDYVALLWNGVAFGILGDVTAWREMDDDGTTQDGPGGAPPNVSWSENLIFGNMWMSSVQKWTEVYVQDLTQAAWGEVARVEAGLPPEDPAVAWRMRHSDDGTVATFEYLRRQLFGSWPLDKGLLRGLLRHLWKPTFGNGPPVTVADFGAGSGRYSQWLNETGLVQAFAFDGTPQVADITGGAVQEVNLAKGGLQMWRTFDWVLCLGVGAYLPEAEAAALLGNVRRHAERGLVVSWSGEQEPSSKLVNPLSEEAVVAFVERETGFAFDRAATALVRKACETKEAAAEVVIFRSTSPPSKVEL